MDSSICRRLVDFMDKNMNLYPFTSHSTLIVKHMITFICSSAHGRSLNRIEHINNLLDEFDSLEMQSRSSGSAVIIDQLQLERQQLAGIITNTFLTEFESFFKVPNLHQLSDRDNSLEKNDILAGFLLFLIQILCFETTTVDWVEELSTPRSVIYWCKKLGLCKPNPGSGFASNQIPNFKTTTADLVGELSTFHSIIYRCKRLVLCKPNPDLELVSNWKKMYALLVEELKLLLVVLGDAPFQYTELKQVQDILQEYETMANEAGSFIYSFLFGPHQLRNKKLGFRIRDVLQKIEFLNEKIKAHCIDFPKLPNSRAAPRLFSSVDMLYIVTSLLRDVEDLVNCRFDLTVDEDIKTHINILHEELTIFRTLLKDIEGSQVTLTGEIKEFLIQANDAGYEVEYLITTYVAGTIPIWYLNLRLPIAVQKLMFMRTRLEEIMKIDNIEGLFGRESSVPLGTRISRPVVDDIVIGYEESKTNILDDLLGRSKNRQTISIFGMPGLGKTTIAKKIIQ